MAQIKLRNVNPVVFNYNVGLGDINPDEKLVINDGNLRFDHGNDGSGLRFKSSSSSGNKSSIRWINQSDTEVFKLTVDPDGNKTDKFTLNAGAVDCVTFLQDGKTGLGKDDPQVRLHVKDGGTETVRFESTSDPSWLRLTNSAGFAQLGARGNDIELAPAGSPKFYFKEAGKLGINTGGAPDSALHVVGDSIRINDQESDASSRLFLSEGNYEGKYGFSLLYAGSANPTLDLTTFASEANTFSIVRHDNNAIGESVLEIARGSGKVTIREELEVDGDIQAGGNILESGSSSNAGSLYISGGNATNTGGSIVLCGSSHTTKTNVVEIRKGSIVMLQITADGKLNIPLANLPSSNDNLAQGDLWKNGESLQVKV
jgi:hypothetical protein